MKNVISGLFISIFLISCASIKIPSAYDKKTGLYYEYDEFNNKTTYSLSGQYDASFIGGADAMYLWISKNGKKEDIDINKIPYIYSIFLTDSISDYLYLESAQLKIGSDVLSMPLQSRELSYYNCSSLGCRHQDMAYYFPMDSQEFAKFILKMADSKEEVKIRFYGKHNYYRERTISKKYQKAMVKVAQSYLDMIKEIIQNEIKLREREKRN